MFQPTVLLECSYASRIHQLVEFENATKIVQEMLESCETHVKGVNALATSVISRLDRLEKHFAKNFKGADT